MRKFLIFTSIFILSLAGSVGAMNVDDITINEAPSAYFYKQEFDKLVLDVTIPGSDKLLAITIMNEGNAKERYDIGEFVLWKDAGDDGFRGMGKDEKIGNFEYNSTNRTWYMKDLDVVIPEQGLRIFVSAEIVKGMTTNRYIRLKIPELDDIDNDRSFDVEDFGIFLESQNNGPIGGSVTNTANQTLRPFSTRDNLAPVSVIDKIETITTENYIITGQSRDQGGSTPAWVKIDIGPSASSGQVNWYNVENTGTNYSTWKYEWEGIVEGSYTIKTQSADWIGNTETEGDSIAVMVDFPDPEPGPDPDYVPEPPLEPSDEGQAGQAELTLEEQLMVQIKDIQEQIIELLNQLVQIYLEELSSI